MGWRILLVEDNYDNFEMVRFLLERADYAVVGARNGREAVTAAREHKPDVILMDLSLPEMDGWEAAREIKNDPTIAGIPLIALTAHTLPGDRQKAMEAGFDNYISKPINVPAFYDIVNAVFTGKSEKN
jgi:two-component system, cell cycle response regulator DivK